MQKYKIGIDEAGRGPWLGSVVAATFSFNPKNLPEKTFIDSLNDSKKLTEKKREKIFSEIIELSKSEKIFFGVGVVDNFFIDEFGIKNANKEAMRRAILEIKRKIEAKNFMSKFSLDVFIDGNDNYVFEELEKKPIYIVAGDAKVAEISAASIIAKVFRDKLMGQYDLLYPELGLKNHKGYGTKKHKDYLQNKAKITGIHRISYKPVKEVLEQKPKLLLHNCCGPDTTIPLVDLKDKFDITCFWYDPNIQPKNEYEKRLEAFKKVCEIENVPYIIGEYDVPNFFKAIKGLEHTPEKGEKCTKCYDLRLKRTALEAKKLGIKYRTTTLAISPHKDLDKLFSLGEKWSKNKDLEFLKIDFRKNRGFERSVEYTKNHGIYRQNYCGCIYSDTFPKAIYPDLSPKGRK